MKIYNMIYHYGNGVTYKTKIEADEEETAIDIFYRRYPTAHLKAVI